MAAALTDMNDNDYAEMGVSDDSVRHVVHYLLYAVFRPRECVRTHIAAALFYYFALFKSLNCFAQEWAFWKLHT